MKNKGFTLIELLAVIVILAIIALIATPIVLNIIKNSKESATIRGAEYYQNAVELAVARNKLDNINLEGEYNILSNGNICNQNDITNDTCNEGKEITLGITGEVPENGTIKIQNGRIIDITLNYDENVVVKNNDNLVIIPKPKSFTTDTWSTIIANVKAGNTDKYEVGAEKEITLTSTDDDSGNADGFRTGTYTVRLANKTTNDSEGVCANSTYSKTACGFVIEFVDIITKYNMNPKGEYKGKQYEYGWHIDGWPGSKMREFTTPVEGIDGSGTIYNAIEDVVRNAIIDTKVVSGYGPGDAPNKESIDKLYLLSTQEVWGSDLTYDKANAETRQLDYYNKMEVTSDSNKSYAIKYFSGKPELWWLRSAACGAIAASFYFSNSLGEVNVIHASATRGVAPAFRIG